MQDIARAADRRAYRLTSIDMLRGIVVVIMALDHVRDFTMVGGIQDPMSDPGVSPALYFTRWITHFCAPVFVLLAGSSAGLMTARKPPAVLAAFLARRGAWLVLIDAAVVSTAITFAPFGLPELGGRTMVVLQVLWAIGASMILLAGAQYLGRRTCLVLGCAIVLGHNLLDPVWPSNALFAAGVPLWVSLHAQMSVIVGPLQVFLVYPLLPWFGVLLVGFGSAQLFEQPPARRNALLFGIGLGMIALFIALRALNQYGDPHPWRAQAGGLVPSLMSFLNTSKYPPSLLYLLMTLGPAAVLCACADRWHGRLKDTLVLFGRVPFAFYIAHFYLAHTLAVVIGVAQGYTVGEMLTFFAFNPKGFGVGLGGVYLAWLAVVLLVYPLCRWVGAVKARRSDWWLSYL